MCTPHRSFILFFENAYWHWIFYFTNLYILNVYNGLFILIYIYIYVTSIIAYLCLFFILFYSYSLYVCILLECYTYCIYWTLWSVTSSYCKWELMFYCFTVPTWNKVFLLLLLLNQWWLDYWSIYAPLGLNELIIIPWIRFHNICIASQRFR